MLILDNSHEQVITCVLYHRNKPEPCVAAAIVSNILMMSTESTGDSIVCLYLNTTFETDDVEDE